MRRVATVIIKNKMVMNELDANKSVANSASLIVVHGFCDSVEWGFDNSKCRRIVPSYAATRFL